MTKPAPISRREKRRKVNRLMALHDVPREKAEWWVAMSLGEVDGGCIVVTDGPLTEEERLRTGIDAQFTFTPDELAEAPRRRSA